MHQALPDARVYRDNAPAENPTVGGTPVGLGPDGGRAWPDLPQSGFNVCGMQSGYETACVPAPLGSDLTLTIVLPLAHVPPAPIPDIEPIAWPPPAREPITSWPEITEDGSGRGFWSHDDYSRTLAFTPPAGPSPDYIRGNFGPLDAPECALPVVPGAFEDRPWMPMSWLLPEYSAEQQVCILKGHQRRGYTHFGTYLPFSHNQGVSDDAFEDALLRVHRAGFWNIVTAFGGDGEDWDRDVRPVLDRFYAAGALKSGDVVLVCWQCDPKYSPYDLAALTKLVADWAHPRGMKIGLHWYSGKIAWWDDGSVEPSTCHAQDAEAIGLAPFCNRFEYGHAMADLVDFQLQQFDPYGALEDARPRAGGIAGELRDSLRAIYGRTRLVVAEYDAQRREDINAPEIEGDAKGLALLSVTDGQGRAATGGFFNGARLPNGEAVR
jgi:hypothetical protein